MDFQQRAIAEFASRNKVVIDFQRYTAEIDVRARYTTDDGVEHGIAIAIGSRRRSGDQPHTMGSAIEEAIHILLEAAT